MRAKLYILTLKKPSDDELNDIILPYIKNGMIDTDEALPDYFDRLTELSGLVHYCKQEIMNLESCEWFIDIDKSIICRYDSHSNFEENKDFEKEVKGILNSSPNCWLSILRVHY